MTSLVFKTPKRYTLKQNDHGEKIQSGKLHQPFIRIVQAESMVVKIMFYTTSSWKVSNASDISRTNRFFKINLCLEAIKEEILKAPEIQILELDLYSKNNPLLNQFFNKSSFQKLFKLEKFLEIKTVTQSQKSTHDFLGAVIFSNHNFGGFGSD